VAAGNKIGGVSFKVLKSIRITRVIHVPFREGNENHLPIRIGAVVDPLPEIFADRRLRCDLPHDVHWRDAVSNPESPDREDAHSFN